MRSSVLSKSDAKKLFGLLAEHSRDLFGSALVDSGRWQSQLSSHLDTKGVEVSQQMISKLKHNGTISVGLARDILRALGDDLDVLDEGIDQQDTETMGQPRARVINRLKAFFPDPVIDALRELPLLGHEDWTEIDWIGELLAGHQRYLRRQTPEVPPSSSRQAKKR